MISTTPSAARSAALPVSPFKGGPTTNIKRCKDGEPKIAVSIDALTPLRARIANWTAGSAGIAGVGGGLYAIFTEGTYTGEAFGTVSALAIAAIPVTRLALGFLLKSKSHVTFSATHIEVTKLTGTRRFERAHPHAFALLTHDKTKGEEERHAFLDRKRPPQWWSLQRKKYYGKSFHVVLTYLGERHDILTVYGRKRATKIQSRLQACDVVMSGIDFGNSGTALSPERDWATDAGGL